MHDLATGVLATPGLSWLFLTFLVAGTVRGFAGFGPAFVIMPVATVFLPVPVAMLLLAVTDMVALPTILPRAWTRADKRDVGLLILAALVTAPFGVWLLTWVAGDILRWLVAGAATVTLIALISGWRYRGTIRRAGLASIGAVAGVVGGATGLVGTPVILFYLAGQAGAASVRANTILFFAGADIMLVANLAVRGFVTVEGLWLAIALAVPYAVGVTLGQLLFRPDRERAFRALAYVVIAGAIIAGLPVFG